MKQKKQMTCQDFHNFSKMSFDPNLRGCFKHHGRKKTEKRTRVSGVLGPCDWGRHKQSTSSEKLASKAKVLGFVQIVL